MFNGTLTGNIGRDPDFSTTQTGQMVSKFSVAVRQPKKQGQDQPAFWVKVECWGKTAEYAANYLKKGNSVCVTGQVSEESWNDKTTGELKKAVVIRNANIESWQSRDDGGQQQPVTQQSYAQASQRMAPPVQQQQVINTAAQTVAQNFGGQVIDDGDIPF
jgi:single-strand DNA-binding protein